VNAAWVLVALVAVGAMVALLTSLLRGDRSADLGTVSHQWVAEHRLGSGQDQRR
jgi:uncharacterized membrane protein